MSRTLRTHLGWTAALLLCVPTLRAVDVPMLWVLAGKDTEAPSDTTFAILRSLQQGLAQLDIVRFPNADHGIIEVRETPEGRQRLGHSAGYFDLLVHWTLERSLSGQFGSAELYPDAAPDAARTGEGPAGGVLRIWAGDRLIVDLRAGAGAYANHPKYRFRIYLGTEDQEIDPLIRQHVENSTNFDGHDATPAFRGLVYIVFEDLPLDEFGNRIPPITAEIAWAGAPQAVVKDTTFLSATGYFTDTVALDAPRGYLYYRTNNSPSELARISVSSGMVEELRVSETELGIDLEGV